VSFSCQPVPPRRRRILTTAHIVLMYRTGGVQRDAERDERDKGKAKAAAVRQSKTNMMRKKTRSGQPVMKHRIDSLLEQIQAGM
jgi:hypothetical protein